MTMPPVSERGPHGPPRPAPTAPPTLQSFASSQVSAVKKFACSSLKTVKMSSSEPPLSNVVILVSLSFYHSPNITGMKGHRFNFHI